MEKYYCDIESSTIKVYCYQNEKLELREEKSILFQDSFSEKEGISFVQYRMLLSYFKNLTEKYSWTNQNTKLYATGIWRQIPQKQMDNLKADFRDLGLQWRVLSHEQENFYFQKAMQGIYDGKRVLMVNMKAKTTELVVIEKANRKEMINLSIGVEELLKQFPNINQLDSGLKIEEIIDYVINQIQDKVTNLKCDCAIPIGGQLRFEKLLDYPLEKNSIFHDGIHEEMISYKAFAEKNEELFYHISLKQLYHLVPNDPKWMDGAKAGLLLEQALFKQAGCFVIVPSDLNLIHGVIKCGE